MRTKVKTPGAGKNENRRDGAISSISQSRAHAWSPTSPLFFLVILGFELKAFTC
jgi:hypothetical protein